MTTKLMEAAFAGNADLVLELLETYSCCRDQEGRTALMLAAQEGHARVVEILAPHEAGQSDEDGWTALMYASWAGNWECVRYLSHQEIRMQDSSGWTALMSAAWNGHIEIVNFLYTEEVEMQDVDGWTALMCAAWNGHLDVVKLLYEREKGMVDKKGWTALMSAAWNGHYAVAKFLTIAEARRMDPYGWTALMSAVWNNHGNIAELLMDAEGSLILENSKAMRMVSVARKNDSITLPSGQQEYLFTKSVVHTSTEREANSRVIQQPVSTDISQGDLMSDDVIDGLQHELKVAYERIRELELLVCEPSKSNTKEVSESLERLREEGADQGQQTDRYEDAHHEIDALNKTIRLMKQEMDRIRDEHQQSQAVLDTLLTNSEDHEVVKLIAEVQKLNDTITAKDRLIEELREKIADQEKNILSNMPTTVVPGRHRARRVNSISGISRKHSDGLHTVVDDCSDIEAPVTFTNISQPSCANVPRCIRKKSISQFNLPNVVPVMPPMHPRESDDFCHPPIDMSSANISDRPEVETMSHPPKRQAPHGLETNANKNISYYEDKSLNSFFQEPSDSVGTEGGTIRQIIREFAKVKKELEQIKRQQISMGKEIQSTKNETVTLRAKVGAKSADPAELKLAIVDVISQDPQILRSMSANSPPDLKVTAVCTPCGHRILTTDPDTVVRCPQCSVPARAISLNG